MNDKLKFLKTHPDAVLPVRKQSDTNTCDSGYDLTAVENVTVPAGGSVVVPVGLTLADVPTKVWIRIESRSGLQFKHQISAFNGIIDNQYRGDLGVKLINSSNVDYHVTKGDRVAQLVCYPLIAPDTDFTDAATSTDRGAKGFGSTGY